MRSFFLFIAVLSGFFLPSLVLAQQKQDTVRAHADSSKTQHIIDHIKEGKLSRRIVKSITRKNPGDPTAAVKSEEAFLPYEGKIIRKIVLRHMDFQRTVYDTTKSIKNTITRIGNKLHSTSKDWLIRDNLFVRENKPLNPYKLADNERYLRDLDFLLDAKFYVIPVRNTHDSVDLVVLTRDVFSLGGTINPADPSKMKFRLYDANLAGWGQRVQFNSIVETDRDPNFNYEFLYRKNSIAGTFINGTVGYTQLNTGSSYGEENEKAYYLRFDRPLVSPYTRYAGGIELSRNWSENFYRVSDSLFRDYGYVVNDVWLGYNIGANSNYDRSRHFVAIRAFDQHFTRLPLHLDERERSIYRDQSFVLASATFFRQDFYTTRYIYGFGRTEDVPYGHNVSAIVGLTQQDGITRPYLGMSAETSFVSRVGEFYSLGLRAGGFTRNGLEDATMLVSGSMMSRLIPKGLFLLRQSFQVDYTRIFRQRTAVSLDINNEFGIQYFRADSLLGAERFHVQSQTLAFTPWELLGFRFAPFAFGEMAVLARDNESIFGEKPYFGFGGGLRTRNENLIFGTVELRVIYYPRTTEDISAFNVRLSSNLRVKYSGSFVRPPALIQYN
jgi:hypothetical protein